MEASLLAFKYKSLKLACQYNEKSITSLGWSCRKYIKWAAVHVGEDRSLLKEFGDAAVDQRIIKKAHLSRVNEVLLNVQKWKLDRENFSIEPELEPAWKHSSELIVSANSNPLVVLSFLKERIQDFGEVESAEFGNIFLKILLLILVTEVLKAGMPDFSMSTEIPTISEFIKSKDDFRGEVYELEVLQKSRSIKESTLMFGLPLFNENHDYESLDHTDMKYKLDLAVVYSDMPLTRFYEYSNSQHARVLYLNSNHSFVKKISKNSDLLQTFLAYLEAYAKTENDNPSLSAEFEDFNSYFSLTLNRFFRN